MRRGEKLFLPGVALCMLISGCGPYHLLSQKEYVAFQPTYCHALPEAGKWSASLRGAVYRQSWLNRIEPEIIDWLETHQFVAGSAEAAISEQRFAPFLDNHPNGIVLGVRIGAGSLPLMPADQSGRLLGDMVLTDAQVSALQSPPDGPNRPRWLTLSVVNADGDVRKFNWRVQVLSERGWTVISDIDDTIKITDVNNTRQMLRNTFVRPFRPVPGMAEVYARWAKEKGAAFHYLSESSIELCAPLTEFLAAAGYPEGSLDLREIEWSAGRLKGYMSLVDAPPQYKIDELKRFINTLPNRDYVLVGDSSQHDPEVYGQTARSYPRQVRRIFIRDVTCQGPDDPRYQEAFRDLPRALWQVFREPSEIRDAFPAPAG